MNRATRARDLLLGNLGKRVTLRMLSDAGLEFYTCRNAVSEAMKDLKLEGYAVTTYTHKPSLGEKVEDNGYVLERVTATTLFDGPQVCWDFVGKRVA